MKVPLMTNARTTEGASDLDVFLARPEPGWWTRRGKWVAIGLGVLLLALAVLRLTNGGTRTEYVTDDVVRGDLSVTVTATGNLAPTNQIDVGSEISGIVRQVTVDANDRVRKGQVLAVIDTARLVDQVNQSRAQLAANAASVAQAKATLAEAQLQLARLRDVQRLSGGRVPADVEMAAQVATVSRARAALGAANANVAAAAAALSSNRTQVERAVIRAPVDGVVLKRLIDPGQTVQAAFNTPQLFIIAEDLTRMKLEVAVDEADVGQVREGQRASFTVDAFPTRTFPASLTRIDLGAKNLTGGSAGTTTGSDVVSYIATLVLTNADLVLRPGMTATATIETAGVRGTLLVPNSALRFTPPASAAAPRGGLKIGPPDERSSSVRQQREVGAGSRLPVYVLETDGHLRAITVLTGRSDGRRTAVSGAGLRAGMTVVTGVKSVASGGAGG
jgi:HlyD family secretion protein